jgi:hypothetical protein
MLFTEKIFKNQHLKENSFFGLTCTISCVLIFAAQLVAIRVLGNTRNRAGDRMKKLFLIQNLWHCSEEKIKNIYRGCAYESSVSSISLTRTH